MKVKVQKNKFIRNIIIGIIALLIVAFIINIAPGYKRNKYANVINLVIGDENVTESLKKPICIDELGNIYISKEDIQQFIDKTIYFDKNNDTIISTSEVSVASMKIDEKKINIDGTVSDTYAAVIQSNDTIYIPIDEVKTVYNIEIAYSEDTNTLIIDELNKGMIKAEAEKQTVIRFKQRSLSKEVGKLEEGEVVSAFYTTSKGWRLIRTSDGKVGYVKANTLTNEYILRQDMLEFPETKAISASIKDGTILNIDGERVIINDLLKLTSEGLLIKNSEITQNAKVWTNLTIDKVDLSNFENRLKIIKNIVSILRKNEITGINVILTNNDVNTQRLVIELAPKLRELGIKTNIVKRTQIEEDNYVNLVDYIITEK